MVQFSGIPKSGDVFKRQRRYKEAGRFSIRRFLRNADGTTAVFFALMSPIVIGALGMGVEVAFWQFKNQQFQSSVDLAAYAGAVALRGGESSSVSEQAAEAEAVNNGFDVAFGTVTANSPPLSGAYMNNSSMEVIIQAALPRIFSGIFSQTPVTTTLRGVATHNPGAPGCIIALNHEASAAISFQGSADTELVGCEPFSNSVAEDSIAIDGSAHVTAPCINAVGHADVNATLDTTNCPEPRENLSVIDDPYAHLNEPPVVGPCSTDSGPYNPGRYCGGLTLNSSTTLSSGVYVIDGGTLRFNANAVVTGLEVMFFLTNGADIRMNGSAEVHLTAPTTGQYAGVLVFADPDSTTTVAKFNGTADSTLIGSLYLPSQEAEMQGNFGGAAGCLQIVADTVTVTGSTTFGSNCTGTGVVHPGLPGQVHMVE